MEYLVCQWHNDGRACLDNIWMNQCGKAKPTTPICLDCLPISHVVKSITLRRILTDEMASSWVSQIMPYMVCPSPTLRT